MHGRVTKADSRNGKFLPSTDKKMWKAKEFRKEEGETQNFALYYLTTNPTI